MHAFSVTVDLVFAQRLMEVNCVFYMLVNINRMQARPHNVMHSSCNNNNNYYYYYYTHNYATIIDCFQNIKSSLKFANEFNLQNVKKEIIKVC